MVLHQLSQSNLGPIPEPSEPSASAWQQLKSSWTMLQIFSRESSSRLVNISWWGRTLLEKSGVKPTTMGYQRDIINQQNHVDASENGVQTHQFMANWIEKKVMNQKVLGHFVWGEKTNCLLCKIAALFWGRHRLTTMNFEKWWCDTAFFGLLGRLQSCAA